ncbi:hypothetical protein GCM10009117_16620 [Gangjinia marincola]|uniref:Secretion system C-terminal sorting domain-containing protein n=1 Tax=Gangjinia marincola TaxID=578463 RepID=A0ABP3XTF5_9FLAO
MKKLLLPVALITAFLVRAQYDVTVTTESYTDITGGTSLNNGDVWDDPGFTIPIGFDFSYQGFTLSEIAINEFGLGGWLSTDQQGTGTKPLLIAYGADIIDRGYDDTLDDGGDNSLSTISYVTEGAAGNRILKIEWNNAGFFSELVDDNISTDFVNLQVWFYEVNGAFQIRFGPNSVTNPTQSYDGLGGPNIELIPLYNLDAEIPIGTGIALTGDPVNPTVVTSNDIELNFISGTVPNGTVYTFTPDNLNVDEQLPIATALSLYPNPAKEYFNIRTPNQGQIKEIDILSLSGQRIETLNTLNKEKIDVSGLAQGAYFIILKTENNQIITKKLIKQ